MVRYQIITVYIFHSHLLPAACITITQLYTVIILKFVPNIFRLQWRLVLSILKYHTFRQINGVTMFSLVFTWSTTSVIQIHITYHKKPIHSQLLRSMNPLIATLFFLIVAFYSNSNFLILHKYIFVTILREYNRSFSRNSKASPSKFCPTSLNRLCHVLPFSIIILSPLGSSIQDITLLLNSLSAPFTLQLASVSLIEISTVGRLLAQ